MDGNATTGQLYARSMQRTQQFIGNVRAEQWSAPTPCTEWTIRDVVNHITGENLWAVEIFAGKTIDEVGDRLNGDLVGSDPSGAYIGSVPGASAAAEAPGAMESTCHLSFGDFPGSEYASQLFLDTLIHGWDVAVASGQDATLDPELVQACLPIARRITEEWRSTGMFGENLAAGAAASPQAELLGMLGRRGDWKEHKGLEGQQG
jgi:uncharacterized protein (TIGR03086 family)